MMHFYIFNNVDCDGCYSPLMICFTKEMPVFTQQRQVIYRPSTTLQSSDLFMTSFAAEAYLCAFMQRQIALTEGFKLQQENVYVYTCLTANIFTYIYVSHFVIESKLYELKFQVQVVKCDIYASRVTFDQRK